MLKRRRRIQKYINALKSKKENLSKHAVLQYSLSKQSAEAQQLTEFMPQSSSWLEKRIATAYEYDEKKEDEPKETELWHDSEDEEQPLAIQANQNVYKKLALTSEPTQAEYEGKLKTFYQKKYKLKNWAESGDGQKQMDIEDYLDQEENYNMTIGKDKVVDKYSSVNHVGRTTEKHESIVTGLDWFNSSVMFTSGFDQKVKIFKVNLQQDNPELKIKLEKDILIEKLPLTSCFYNRDQIYCGTLRKNLAIIDPIKEKITYVTSSFLGDHKKYENLRLNKSTNQKLLFSNNKISVLDYKNSYTGSLLANDELKDVKFGHGSPYELFGVTNDAVYEWDLRTYKPVKIDKTFLGYSALEVGKDYLCAGSRLGMVYVYENNKDNSDKFTLHKEVTNLTTTITNLSSSPSQGLVCALSKWKNNAARVIELNTGRCVGNWPTPKTKIQFGNVGGFSSDGNVFAVGSSNGYINVFGFQNIVEN